MKACNLITIAELYKNSPESFDAYLHYLKTEVKAQDITPLISLLERIPAEEQQEKSEIFDGFFIGYKLPQLNKEFDLLRINEDSVLNIELKTEEHFEDIKKQILRHKYYLNPIKKNVSIFTFVEKTNNVYKLSDNEIIKTDIATLLAEVKLQSNCYYKTIDFLFNPATYLISPFNKTEDFVNDNYFLTDRQEQIEKEIIDSIGKGKSFFLITGSAGTGKTLLTYHLAKKLRQTSKSVTIVHCGMLNNGHYKLINEYKWNIIPVKNYKTITSDTEVIIIDEIQRINFFQFNSMVDEHRNSVFIFSGDEKQILSDEENFFGKLEENDNKPLTTYNLTKKIRTNEVVASFIYALFDKKKRVKNPNNFDDKISVKHFFKIEDVYSYITSKANYQFITYTPSLYKSSQFDLYQFEKSLTAHKVVGQEFENVIVLLDSSFYYDNNILKACNYPKVPYSVRKMLYQQVSRTINSLEIVVFDNPKLFSEILEILL